MAQRRALVNIGGAIKETPTGDTLYGAGGGGISWTTASGTTQAAAVNTAYVCTNASLCTVTLPSTAAVGGLVGVMAQGAGGWKLAQNAGQSVGFKGSSTTAGTGGYLQSGTLYGYVVVVCVVANTTWAVVQCSQDVVADTSGLPAGSCVVDKFTSNGTWTKRPGAKWVEVFLMSSGGGGGSGGNRSGQTRADAGGGGAGGDFAYITTDAALLSATENVTIGGAASGGVGVTGDTNGNQGAARNISTFGTANYGTPTVTSPVITNGAGNGGQANGGSGQGGGTGLYLTTVSGTSNIGNSGGATAPGNFAGAAGAASVGCAASGGGGGGCVSVTTLYGGGAGGDVKFMSSGAALVSGGAGAAAGANNGSAGNAPSGVRMFCGGSGGGGGGGASGGTRNNHKGGDGGAPGGGGGGSGAGWNSGYSGDGGQGARGEVWVVTYF